MRKAFIVALSLIVFLKISAKNPGIKSIKIYAVPGLVCVVNGASKSYIRHNYNQAVIVGPQEVEMAQWVMQNNIDSFKRTDKFKDLKDFRALLVIRYKNLRVRKFYLVSTLAMERKTVYETPPNFYYNLMRYYFPKEYAPTEILGN